LIEIIAMVVIIAVPIIPKNIVAIGHAIINTTTTAKIKTWIAHNYIITI